MRADRRGIAPHEVFDVTTLPSLPGQDGQVESFTPRYDFDIDTESNSVHAKVVRLVGTDKRVLELGCATGYMSRVLRARQCRVVAIEIDAKMAERATPFCERVIVGDIEQLDLAAELGDDKFDVIVAADFLEHLKDPLSTLQRVKQFLHPDGYVVASLPNVAHGSIRLALLGGRFPYNQRGLLDYTHLRFFTRETMEKLFEEAGFAIGHLDRQSLLFEASEVSWDVTRMPSELVELLSNDPDAQTYQFILVAYPLSRPDLRAIQERIRAFAQEKEAAVREVAELRNVVDKQSALQGQLQALVEEKEVQLRAVVEEKDAQLRAVVEEKDAQLRAVAEEKDAQLRAVAEERDAALDEAKRLRQSFDEQTDHLQMLTERIDLLTRQKEELRTKLLEAHDQLVRRDDEVRPKLELLERELRAREQHIADLQAALDRILYSVPGRLYRRLRTIVTLGRR